MGRDSDPGLLIRALAAEAAETRPESPPRATRVSGAPVLPEVRYYCVWSLPAAREGPGLYYGPHPEVWALLCHQSGSPRPLSAGARLKRYPSLEAARADWVAGAPRALRESLDFPSEPPLWVVHRG